MDGPTPPPGGHMASLGRTKRRSQVQRSASIFLIITLTVPFTRFFFPNQELLRIIFKLLVTTNSPRRRWKRSECPGTCGRPPGRDRDWPDFSGQLEAVVDEQVEEEHVKAGVGEEAQQVGPPQTSVSLCPSAPAPPGRTRSAPPWRRRRWRRWWRSAGGLRADVGAAWLVDAQNVPGCQNFVLTCRRNGNSHSCPPERTKNFDEQASGGQGDRGTCGGHSRCWFTPETRQVQAASAEKTTSRFQKEIYEPFYQNKLHFTPDRINGNDKVYEGIIVFRVILDCLHILALI